MFQKLRRARADLAVMNELLPAAERIARADGTDRPGAEHLVVAALDLDDGIGRSALETFHVDPAQLRSAIARQHEDALRAIGVLADDDAITAAMPPGDQPRGPYRSQGSLQQAFQRAVELAKDRGEALTSGHILLAATEAEHGTVARSLEHLAVDRTLLRSRTHELIEG